VAARHVTGRFVGWLVGQVSGRLVHPLVGQPDGWFC
jgi:hypothetical protein